MEPNNQKTNTGPAYSNIPINSHPPQVISPTSSQSPNQSPVLGYENGSADIPQSVSPAPTAAEPAAGLPIVPVSNRPSGGRFGRFKNKKFAIAGVAALSVVLAAGVVFGWYIPNKPENVYRAGLDRTGEAFEKLVQDSFSEDKLQILENSSLSGNVNYKAEDSSISADFSSTYDLKASDSSLDAKFKNQQEAEKKIGLKLLTDLPKDAYMPNIYFKLVGLNTLGADSYYPGLSAYEDKWIAVTSDYLQSFLPREEGSEPGNFTHADAKELATVITKKTREYLFTADTTKAVLIRKSFVATENSEGLKANRYKVGLNKSNAKKYCQELTRDILSTKAYKRLSGSGDEAVKDQAESTEEACDRNINDVSDDTEFDLWIDKRTKLVHKVRFTDKDDKNSYTEIGQLHKGGDKLPFFVNLKSDKEKYSGRFDLVVDTKSNTTVGKFVMKQDGDYTYDLDISFTFKPHDGPVKVEKPADSISLQEVLEKLGAGEFLSAGSSDNAADSERKSDIRALQSKLAEYYALNGFYPSLGQMNNTSFRVTNGIPAEAVQDPANMTPLFGLQSAPGQYGYNPSNCGTSGSECQNYVLSATLSDGTVYEVNSY